MPRALSQILSELDTVYNPQKESYQGQIAALDPQQNAEMQGLDAAKTDAFQQITDTANRRGLFYSGIPVGEQQRYTGANYLPAVANLKGRYAQQRFSLQDAISNLTKDQYNKAYDIQGQESAAEAARAAAGAGGSGGFAPSFGLGGNMGANGQVLGSSNYNLSQRSNGGFNFQGPNGQAISAAQYAQANGIPLRSLLQQMANAGDGGAKAALGLVGNDYGFNRNAVTSQSQLNLLKALGINTGGYAIPTPQQTTNNKVGLKSGGGLVSQLQSAFHF